MRYSRLGIGLLACLFIVEMNSQSAQAGVNPQKIFAVAHSQPSGLAEIPNAPSDSILFYDVSSIGVDPNASSVFDNDPLFSVWVGYEIFDGNLGDNPTGIPTGNREDVSALTFNPANGTIYALAFDSGTSGFGDPVGDVQGDWDLYKIDYQAILDDFVDNARPKGTIYAPQSLGISVANETFLQTNNSVYFDGTVDGVANEVPHPSDPNGTNTVFLPGNFEKIGQLGRSQPNESFFDVELDFVNPETLVALDTFGGDATEDPATNDFTIRVFNRVATVPNQVDQPEEFPFPPFPGDIQEGGWQNINPDYNPIVFPAPDPNGLFTSAASESWESNIAAFLQLDPNTASDAPKWGFVNHNGTIGVWASDSDGANNGDDLAFYKLDISDPNNPTATKQSLSNSNPAGGNGSFLSLADDPSADPNSDDGEIDNLLVDRNGNLVIVESGFFDTDPNNFTPPIGADGFNAEEPKVITIGIENYDDGGVVTTSAGTGFLDSAAYDVTAGVPVTGPIDNDDAVTNATNVGYDKSTGYIYIIDQDPNEAFREDIYVFDPVTETIVYHELSPFDIGIFNAGTQIIFIRGDINGDGVVTYADVKELQDGVIDPTLGGTVSAAVGAEWYDLTGDGVLTAADVTELIEVILGTRLGDFNLDGLVDAQDFLEFQRGDIADFDGGDLADWNTNYGFSHLSAAASTVPEPSSLLLVCMTLGMLSRFRNRN